MYERHYFYKGVKTVISYPEVSNSYLSYSSYGGYTLDADKDGINDSWEKLAYAACINPDQAFQLHQYRYVPSHGFLLQNTRYTHPIEMLWSASRSESSHYKMFADYILKVANIKSAFLKISTNSENNRAFCLAYPTFRRNHAHQHRSPRT